MLNYIIFSAIGYLISDIINQVKRNLKDYPLAQAMQAQQIRIIEESRKE